MTLEELRDAWRPGKPENGRIQEKIWDERAEDFEIKELPSAENNEFLRYLYEKARPDRSMSALDIGCGGGKYSLALAKDVREVAGTDVSGRMLEAARRYARKEQLSNVNFYKEDWQTADIDALGFRGRFDLVFAHMTPAIADYGTLDKMNACAKGHCFLVKPARREDAVQDAAFLRAGLLGREQLDEAVMNTFAYLWLKGYEPELSYRKEVWKSTRSLESMERWCVDRARLRKELTKEEEQAIRSFLREISRDGTVEETTRTTIVTIYWNVANG